MIPDASGIYSTTATFASKTGWRISKMTLEVLTVETPQSDGRPSSDD